MEEKFDIQRALEWEVNKHGFSFLVGENNIQATTFPANQAVKLDLKAGAEVIHSADGFFSTIDCLDGAIVIECKAQTYQLDANTKDTTGFSFPAPYTIIAKRDSRVLVLVRPWIKRYRTLAEIEAAEDRADIREAKRVREKSDPVQRKTLDELRKAVGR